MRHEGQRHYFGGDQSSTHLDAQWLPNTAQYSGHVAHSDVVFQGWREGTTGQSADTAIFMQDGEPRPWDSSLLDLQADKFAEWRVGLDGRQRLATDEVFSRSRFAQTHHPAEASFVRVGRLVNIVTRG